MDIRPAPPHPLLTSLSILVLGCAWSLQVVCAKVLGEVGGPPVASLLVMHVGLVCVLRAGPGRQRLTCGELVRLAIASLLGNVLSLAAELLAAPHVPCHLMSLLVSSTPVCACLLAVCLGTERVRPRTVLGVTIGLCGVFLVLQPAGGVSTAWLLVALLVPTSFAGMVVMLASPGLKRLGARSLATWNARLGCLWLLPLAGWEGRLSDLPTDGTGLLALVGFGATLGVEYILVAVLTRTGGAVRATCAEYVAVAFGLVWAATFFGETIALPTMLAASACLVAPRLVQEDGPAGGSIATRGTGSGELGSANGLAAPLVADEWP